MQKYKVSITLIRDALIGSGEGYGDIIDSDIIFDDIGIPYIPARRIKGLLRDSAEDAINIFNTASISYLNENTINKLYGNPGQTESSPISIPNFYIDDYEQNYEWLKYYSKDEEFGNFISKESIINSFTSIRRQTSLEDGVAKEHSLRTIRVLNKGTTFSGEIEIFDDNIELKKLLILSFKNLRKIGTKRNRGLGEVECKLKDTLNDWAIKELEVLCKD